MRRLLSIAVALLVSGATARAQDASVAGRCATPDTIAFRGIVRVTDATIRSDAGLVPGPVNYRALDRAIRAVYATGQYADVRGTCELNADGSRATLVLTVKERPLLTAFDVTGTDRISRGDVRDRIETLVGRPLDPAQVTRSLQRIDSLYQSEGYYLARVKPETTTVSGQVTLLFRVDEGKRLAVSGIDITGNQGLSDKEVVAAMETQPEGFLWFHRGELDADKFAGDLGERIPALYASRGYLDAQVVKDTIQVDRTRGKALVNVKIQEGVRYRIGTFEATGSRRFSSEDLQRFYPFGVQPKSLTGALKGVVHVGRGNADTTTYFDAARWEDATHRVSEAYQNEGYIYASVRPIVDRVKSGPDSVPTVNLRWEVAEGSPAIVNRVDILGNDVTTENCIRNQIFLVPGDVFRRDALMRSYQNIGNLGFFETPIPQPDTKPNEQGDLDVIFHVKEKRTGNLNFGASVGQQAGIGGFLGFDQPNLFGMCKKGSVNIQYGAYIKDVSLSYTDPFIKESQVSGTVTIYDSQQRFYVSDVGRQERRGAQAQLGFPVMGSRASRIFLSYGAEHVSYGDQGLVSTINCSIITCTRSTVGLTFEHDTRAILPFPTDGGKQSLTAEFNGLLGGAQYTRYRGEMRHYASLITFGGGGLGSDPVILGLGLSVRAGALFGDPGGFYVSQKFSMGGVQYGEQLRGYDEFSITPQGYIEGGTGTYTAQQQSFGSAFYASTAELNLRINQQLNLDAFYDAGNIWARPRDFNPTRLFRGVGFGASIITPLGPLGLDYGFGLDKTLNGVRKPIFSTGQLHFKLGQIF